MCATGDVVFVDTVLARQRFDAGHGLPDEGVRHAQPLAGFGGAAAAGNELLHHLTLARCDRRLGAKNALSGLDSFDAFFKHVPGIN